MSTPVSPQAASYSRTPRIASFSEESTMIKAAKVVSAVALMIIIPVLSIGFAPSPFGFFLAATSFTLGAALVAPKCCKEVVKAATSLQESSPPPIRDRRTVVIPNIPQPQRPQYTYVYQAPVSSIPNTYRSTPNSPFRPLAAHVAVGSRPREETPVSYPSPSYLTQPLSFQQTPESRYFAGQQDAPHVAVGSRRAANTAPSIPPPILAEPLYPPLPTYAMGQTANYPAFNDDAPGSSVHVGVGSRRPRAPGEE
jgi:hypothetical protein